MESKKAPYMCAILCVLLELRQRSDVTPRSLQRATEAKGLRSGREGLNDDFHIPPKKKKQVCHMSMQAVKQTSVVANMLMESPNQTLTNLLKCVARTFPAPHWCGAG